jgi:hypothetical protein
MGIALARTAAQVDALHSVNWSEHIRSQHHFDEPATYLYNFITTKHSSISFKKKKRAFKPISFACGAPPEVADSPKKTIQPTEHRMAGVTRFEQNKARGIPELYTAHTPVHNIALLFPKCEHNQKLYVHVDTSPRAVSNMIELLLGSQILPIIFLKQTDPPNNHRCQ